MSIMRTILKLAGSALVGGAALLAAGLPVAAHADGAVPANSNTPPAVVLSDEPAIGAATGPNAAQIAAATPDEKKEFTGKSAGDFMVRLRGLAVIPRDHADHINPIGGDVQITNAYVPEVDLSYFITDNIAIEAIAAITKHDVKAKSTSLGDVDLGSVWLLPPTILLQYHVLPKERISPYVGAGVNYSFFFNDDTPDDGPVKSIHYSDSFGWALQAGVDIALSDDIYLNVDVKHLWLNNKVSINNGAIKAKVDVDPWIVGAGLGFKF
jgi:outer membrane protein